LSAEFRQKVIQGVAWSATQNWGMQAIAFFIFLILARLLEPAAFGMIAIATVFVAFIEVFIDQGFADALIQRAELEPEHLDTAFWISILTGSLLTIAAVLLSGSIAQAFGEPQLASVLAWLSLGILLGALSSTQQALLKRQLAFKALAVRAILAKFAGGAVGIAMAFLGFGVWSLVAQILIDGTVAAIVLWLASDWRPGLRFSRSCFTELFLFGVNSVGFRVLNFFNRRSDDLLIGYFLGPTALGYYTVAYKILLTLTKLLIYVVDSVAFPAFSRLQADLGQMRRAFYKAIQFTSLVAFPVFVGVSLLAHEIILGLYGQKWSAAIPVMQILALVGVLHSVLFFNYAVMLACGRPAWRLGIILLNAVANVIAFMLVVRWGIVAVAAAYVIIGYLLWPVSLGAVKRLIQINLKDYFQLYLVPVAGCIIMSLVVFSFKYMLDDLLPLYGQLGVYSGVGAVSYLVFIQLKAPSLSQQTFILVRPLLVRLKITKVA